MYCYKSWTKRAIKFKRHVKCHHFFPQCSVHTTLVIPNGDWLMRSLSYNKVWTCFLSLYLTGLFFLSRPLFFSFCELCSLIKIQPSYDKKKKKKKKISFISWGNMQLRHWSFYNWKIEIKDKFEKISQDFKWLCSPNYLSSITMTSKKYRLYIASAIRSLGYSFNNFFFKFYFLANKNFIKN